MIAWLADQLRMARCDHAFEKGKSTEEVHHLGFPVHRTVYVTHTCTRCGYHKRRRQ